jgi:hypothetical protein
VTEFLDIDAPVFSKKRIADAYIHSVTATIEQRRTQAELLGSRSFKKDCAARQISDEVSERMLEVACAIVEAERAWKRHAILSGANVDAVSGRRSRDEALVAARDQLTSVPSLSAWMGGDAHALRDAWKHRLETGQESASEDTRAYGNPWFDYFDIHAL